MTYLGGTPMTTSDPTGKFIIPYRNREEFTGVSAAAPTASGLNLIVTLNNSAEVRFRNGDVIFDNLSKAAGRIISGGGTNVLTIEPLNGFTFSTSTMFQAGSNITVLYDMSAINTSTGKVSLYTGFNEYYDYCLFMRDQVQYNRSDKLTVIQTAPEGAKFFYNQATVDTMARFKKNRATAFIYGKSALQNSAYQGQVAGYRGMRDAAIAEGYPIQQSTSLTAAQFVDMAYYVADTQPDCSQRLTYMGARQALAKVQSFYPTQIVQNPVVTTIAGRDLGALAYSKTSKRYNLQVLKQTGFIQPYYRTACYSHNKLHRATLELYHKNTIYMFTTPTIPAINPQQSASQCITRVVPTWSGGELEVSTQPGAFSRVIQNADGSWLATSDTTGWTEYYGMTEGYHFQGQQFAIFELTA